MKKNTRSHLLLIALLGATSCAQQAQKTPEEPKNEKSTPNIIFIMADDLGYGDVSCYGSTKLKTPNIDRLAANGLRFTNGYSTSATSTPSRYALLTGSYPWRNERAQILAGDAPMLIDTATVTLPAMLKNAGYRTAVVGKWHLGLGYGSINWNRRISPSPNQTGFDYSFIMAATNDRVPTVYVENGMVCGLDSNDPLEVSYETNFQGEPTALTNPELCNMKWHHGHNNSVHNGIPRIGFMRGGKSALWTDENMADTFLTRAIQFIDQNKSRPFFLYYALHQPHVPRVPHPRFAGKSGMGPRGDVILELDWCVGELLNYLEKNKLTKNTWIIFSSDNGPVLNDGYYDQAVELNNGHTPTGPLRGGKYSLFEAGTRVPFISCWQGTILPGVSDALVSQLDVFASLAALIGQPNTATDSKNLLDALLGKTQKGRSEYVMEATGRLAYRNQNMVYIPAYDGPAISPTVGNELGNAPSPLLFDLGNDPAQKNNLADSQAELIARMDSLMQIIIHK